MCSTRRRESGSRASGSVASRPSRWRKSQGASVHRMERAADSTLREASAFDSLDPAGVYFGTQSGTVWASPDPGGAWIEAARDLPPVLSVEVAEL